MNHPSDDELLLLAYGELPEAPAALVNAHAAACTTCRDRLGRLEQARVAAGWALERPRRWVARGSIAVLAAAAVAAGVLLVDRQATDRIPRATWPPHQEWSANAGYIAGGRPVIAIDEQLTRLEQGWSYVRP